MPSQIFGKLAVDVARQAAAVGVAQLGEPRCGSPAVIASKPAARKAGAAEGRFYALARKAR